MENKTIFVILSMLLVISTAALLLYLAKPIITGVKTCGVENCHGLEVSCGPNLPLFCTETYEVGDRCRQYASCQIVNGNCSLVTGKEFDDCKTCVEMCLEKEDSRDLYRCENQC
jgi:hypothetical protein